MECPFNSEKEPAYYGSYLAVDKLLGLQAPLSLIEGKLHAHDEMLFIIVHQTYELWFKQILHELQACCEVLQQPSAADDNGPDMNVVVHRLKRIVEIWKLLNHQVDVLETMTPLDFLDFRSSLEGASGFQSTQFRQIEATLGLRMENRFRPDYYKHTEMGGFNPADYSVIVEAEKTTTLLQLVEQWLVRMPFFEESFWQGWDESTHREGDAPAEPADRANANQSSFWNQYRKLYEASLSDRDEKGDLLGKFDETFFKTGAGDFLSGVTPSRSLHHALPRRTSFPPPVRPPQHPDRNRRTAGKLPLPPSPNGPENDRNQDRHRRKQRRTVSPGRRKQELHLQRGGRCHNLPDRATEPAQVAQAFTSGITF